MCIRDRFNTIAAAYRETFRTWKGGRYLKYFKPEFKAAERAHAFGGMLEGTLYYNDEHADVATPADFYRLAEGVILPLDELVVDFDKVRVADSRAA